MSTEGLVCRRCKVRWFPGAPARAQGMQRCPACGVQVEVRVYPALMRTAAAVSAQPVVSAAEAPCFFHPTQRAAVACEECGCFLCSLCDLEFGGRHLCPNCLEAAEKESKAEALQRHRVRHDHVVWGLLLLPLLACGLLMPLTAPLALGYALWKWRTAESMVSRVRLRLALAVPVAVAELAGGTWFWVVLLTQ